MNRCLQRATVLRQSHLERSNDAKHNHLAQEVREEILNALHGLPDSNAEWCLRTIRFTTRGLAVTLEWIAVQVLSKAPKVPNRFAAAD